MIATTLALYHALPRFIVSARAHSHWISQGTTLNAEKFGIRELRGRTMGVLGYGHIGREIGRMAKLMGMTVVGESRFSLSCLATSDPLNLSPCSCHSKRDQGTHRRIPH